ncbi:ABC transporter family substrate-binding protein [Nakamurella flavida]
MGLTALVASAALVLAACSGTPGQQGATTSASSAPSGSAGGSASASGTESASSGTPITESPEAANVGKVGGSACGIPHGPYADPSQTGGEVRAAWNDPPLSWNNNTTHGNAVATFNVQYLTNLGFSYYDGDLNLINNDQFGTCTLVSEDPLTVKYTIADGVKWSDGTPVTADDLVLSWAAQSGVFNDEEAQTDDDGNLLPTAGVAFDKLDPSLSLIKDFPTIEDDNRSATFVWSEYYVDYQTAGPANNGGPGTLIPAHVLGAKALNITDPTAAAAAVTTAFKNNDKASLKPVADFWNTGFDTDQLPSDPSLYLSTGPYKTTAYQQRASLTFEKMDGYTWGPKPIADTIQYQIIGEATAAVQALTNEEVDVISPQSTADIYEAVSALSDRGIQVKTGDGGTYEHVDLVFANGGPFDPATYGGDTEKAKKVRQAFLKTVPRQDILDRLIKPINPEAVLRQSYTTVPGAPAYDAITEANGMGTAYGTVDIEGAKALLAEAGVTGTVDVRLKFAENNARRSNEYDLMKASAQEAGFNLVDGRSASWGQELPAIDGYDASLFGWQSTSTGVAEQKANYVTDGSNNYGLYSSSVVDDAENKLTGSVLSEDERTELLSTIEKQLVDDAFGVTIFQFPNVTAWNENRVTGVSDTPLAPGVFFNFWDWQPVS